MWETFLLTALCILHPKGKKMWGVDGEMKTAENPSQWCAGSCRASNAIVLEEEGQFISQAQLAA